MNKNTKYSIGVVVLIIAAIVATHYSRSVPWKTYVQKDNGFSVSYPSNWVMLDEFTATSTCCLFIAHWQYSTTTVDDASGTPRQQIKAAEMIKLQIGTYVRGSKNDPFVYGTTSQITVGGSAFYKGTSGALDYYLLPRDEKSGVGAGIFNYIETPQADKDIAKKIATSIRYVATTSSYK